MALRFLYMTFFVVTLGSLCVYAINVDDLLQQSSTISTESDREQSRATNVLTDDEFSEQDDEKISAEHTFSLEDESFFD